MSTPDHLDIQDPKRNPSARTARAGWYPYYAGFSPTFADSWSIRASLPEGDARKFSKVDAPGSPVSAGQEVIYQSLQGLPKQAEIKFYFK